MANQVSAEWLFPVPLFRKDLDDFPQRQAELILYVSKMREQDPGVAKSNVGGWQSNNLQHFSDEPLIWLQQQVVQTATESLQHFGKNKSRLDVHMDGGWFNINKADEWNTPHTHMPCRWSGVFYIDVDDSPAGRRSGNIIFIDPIPLGPTYRNPINSFAIPRSGLMLIFPGYLTHMVEPHKSPRDRISFSFNFHTSHPTDPNKSSDPPVGS